MDSSKWGQVSEDSGHSRVPTGAMPSPSINTISVRGFGCMVTPWGGYPASI